MSARDLDLSRIRELATYVDQPVPADIIDENGHMNITGYFAEGSTAVWVRLRELGMTRDYIEARAMSFFTVEQHLGYLGELRQATRYSIRVGFVARTAKALHGVAYFVDEDHDRLACAMEILYVHVSMDTRRAVEIPDDLTAALDAEIAAHPWLADAATALHLRR